MRFFAILLVTAFWLSSPVQAEVREIYDFDSRAEEQRFQKLISELRCPMCQNENIADSSAPISRDMRDQVYRQMQDGATNDEIVDTLVSRFGEFVKYKPPFDRRTFLLWTFPAISVFGGLLVVIGVVWRSRRRNDEDTALSSDDQARAERILSEKSNQSDR